MKQHSSISNKPAKLYEIKIMMGMEGSSNEVAPVKRMAEHRLGELKDELMTGLSLTDFDWEVMYVKDVSKNPVAQSWWY